MLPHGLQPTKGSSPKVNPREQVLRTVEKGSYWGKVTGFEVVHNGVNGIRYIDIMVKDADELVRIEVKSWKKMYAPTFIKQFVEKDLANVTSLNNLKWVFDGKYSGVLKDDITKVLKSAKGKEALNDKLPNEAKKIFFPGFDELDGINDNDIDKFIDTNYSKIFTSY